jgi:hypothetical protein
MSERETSAMFIFIKNRIYKVIMRVTTKGAQYEHIVQLRS